MINASLNGDLKNFIDQNVTSFLVWDLLVFFHKNPAATDKIHTDDGRSLRRVGVKSMAMAIENATLLEKARQDAATIEKYSKDLEKEVEITTDRLSDSEKRFQTLIESSNTAIIAYDVVGRVTEANAAAGELLGCSVSSLVGKKLGELEKTLTKYEPESD